MQTALRILSNRGRALRLSRSRCADRADARGVLRSTSVVATESVLVISADWSVEQEAEALSVHDRYHRGPRACSSADRASASGA
jgi:hypothetical protein